jgi:hypothetical protein
MNGIRWSFIRRTARLSSGETADSSALIFKPDFNAFMVFIHHSTSPQPRHHDILPLRRTVWGVVLVPQEKPLFKK